MIHIIRETWHDRAICGAVTKLSARVHRTIWQIETAPGGAEASLRRVTCGRCLEAYRMRDGLRRLRA